MVVVRRGESQLRHHPEPLQSLCKVAAQLKLTNFPAWKTNKARSNHKGMECLWTLSFCSSQQPRLFETLWLLIVISLAWMDLVCQSRTRVSRFGMVVFPSLLSERVFSFHSKQFVWLNDDRLLHYWWCKNGLFIRLGFTTWGTRKVLLRGVGEVVRRARNG